MKTLEIKLDGWLHSVAKIGGMKGNFVEDKTIEKQNRILRKLYNDDHIDQDEYYEKLRDSTRPINFCEFTRHVLFGCLFVALCTSVAGTVTFWWIQGTWVLLSWAFHGFGVMTNDVKMSLTMWGVVFVLGAIISATVFLRKWREEMGYRGESVDSKTARKLREKYRRREIRSAFWESIRNKTCFKMQIK